MNERDEELCAKCGFTLYNHIGNTGCVFPCWTPSAKYSENKRVNHPIPSSPTPEELAEWTRRSEEAKAHPETLLSLDEVRERLDLAAKPTGEPMSTQMKGVGLYHKFAVARVDGRSARGEKHFGCEYFVLDLNHDRFASAAIVAYARKCSDEYPELADDLLRRAEKMSEWMAQDALDRMTPSERKAWTDRVHNNPERR